MSVDDVCLFRLFLFCLHPYGLFCDDKSFDSSNCWIVFHLNRPLSNWPMSVRANPIRAVFVTNCRCLEIADIVVTRLRHVANKFWVNVGVRIPIIFMGWIASIHAKCPLCSLSTVLI